MYRAIAVFITSLNRLAQLPAGVGLGINFRELRKAEVRRIFLPRTPVNKGLRKGRGSYYAQAL